MESDPVQACVAALQQAGWHVTPTASPWNVVSEVHADRWWCPQLVDTAVLCLPTGMGVLQRVQITLPADGAGPPQHQVVATSGLQSLAALPSMVTGWPPAGPNEPDAEASESHQHPGDH